MIPDSRRLDLERELLQALQQGPGSVSQRLLAPAGLDLERFQKEVDRDLAPRSRPARRREASRCAGRRARRGRDGGVRVSDEFVDEVGGPVNRIEGGTAKSVVEYVAQHGPGGTTRELPNYAVVPNFLGKIQEYRLQLRRPGEYAGWLGTGPACRHGDAVYCADRLPAIARRREAAQVHDPRSLDR